MSERKGITPPSFGDARPHHGLSIEEIAVEIKNNYSGALNVLRAFENIENELHQAYAAIAENAAKVTTEFKRATEAEYREKQLIAKLEQRDNGLKWIHRIAWMHGFGGGFEPRHMYALAELADKILEGEPMKDFTEVQEEARIAARAQWEKLKDCFD